MTLLIFACFDKQWAPLNGSQQTNLVVAKAHLKTTFSDSVKMLLIFNNMVEYMFYIILSPLKRTL